MAQQTLNRTKQQIKFKTGLEADINTDATKNLAVVGEPHWCTDNGQLYMFNGTENVHIPTMDSNNDYGHDFSFGDSGSGIILIDRTTADRYRLYIDSGVLNIEAV